MAVDIKFRYSQRTSIARGTTVDAYLPEKETKILYDGWSKKWPEPYCFRGGIKAITCEMILAVPYKELKGVYGVKRANRFLEVSQHNAGR